MRVYIKKTITREITAKSALEVYGMKERGTLGVWYAEQ